MAGKGSTEIVLGILPCRHDHNAVIQIKPTVDLLNTLDTKYPQVLIAENITPEDYHGKKVFRSAIETIRGKFIASSKTMRHAMVQWVLEGIKGRGDIVGFEHTGSTRRYDFQILFSQDPHVGGVIEVKGGEGNSVNISDRPIWAEEFLVWCHLDGAITNQPSNGASAVITRLTNELINRQKLVDALIVRDALCGTPLRPCPKYPEGTVPTSIAPDIFLFPQRLPCLEDPTPPVHSLDTLRLPRMILDFFDVPPSDYPKHLWEVHVEIVKRMVKNDERIVRQTAVYHQGEKL